MIHLSFSHPHTFMITTAARISSSAAPAKTPYTGAAAPLYEGEVAEALAFLARRPLHSVILAGWLTEFGVRDAQLRGNFFKHRDESGAIDGIALIGRHTLFESRRPEAVRAFADLARERGETKMFLSEADTFDAFWRHYSLTDHRPQLVISESFFCISEPLETHDRSSELRPASIDDLDLVVDAHAALVVAETGIDPRANEASGFRQRCRERVERGDVWLWTDADGRLVFKVDVVSRTREAVYCEGLWVGPEFRGRGCGRRGLEDFCSRMLDGQNSVCLFADARNAKLQHFYLRSGFLLTGRYDKIHL